MLRSLEDKTHRGGFVASPAAPWGESCRDGDQVYHMIWTRDLFHIVSALHDMGDASPALRALEFLARRQRPDGAWDQNFRLDGKAHWTGIELDEVAYPILLAWRLSTPGVLEEDPWPDLVKQIVDGGHEVGHHGWVHENPAKLELAAEREVMERGFEALQHAAFSDLTPAELRDRSAGGRCRVRR